MSLFEAFGYINTSHILSEMINIDFLIYLSCADALTNK